MNPIIFILLCFAALGLFDKMFKNRLGLATSFDRGIITMGDFMMSVGGFYCIAIAFLNGHATLFKNKEMLLQNGPNQSEVYLNTAIKIKEIFESIIQCVHDISYIQYPDDGQNIA